jgi:hypothetical protein
MTESLPPARADRPAFSLAQTGVWVRLACVAVMIAVIWTVVLVLL